MIRLSLSIFIISSLSLFSCGEEEGACEVKQPSATGGASYYCYNEVSSDLCGNLGGVEAVYHEGTPCTALGYTVASGSNFEGRYTVEANDLSKPGANGAFKDDTSNNQGGNCSEEYEGPLFDTQIDSQCQLAYIYACENFQQGVDAACDIYRTFQANDPSIPDCPYCG